MAAATTRAVLPLPPLPVAKAKSSAKAAAASMVARSMGFRPTESTSQYTKTFPGRFAAAYRKA
jgi:hypothetical protein